MIIFLNGAKDAGKSTTATHLQQMDERIAVVEPDVFYPFLPDHLSVLEKAPHCVTLSARCAQELYDCGFIVIIAYPLTDADYVRYRSLLAVPDSLQLVLTLAPKKERLLERVGLVDDQSDEGRYRRMAIEQHYETEGTGFGVVTTHYPAHLIDTTHQTPQETAHAVYARIRAAEAEQYTVEQSRLPFSIQSLREERRK